MYWLVRGAVAVTSRDGEATYAELRPGAFFGEIGILMDVPRTATIIARTKCLLLVLKKEDFRSILPLFPDMQTAIMEEAQERLTILNKKREESGFGPKVDVGVGVGGTAVPSGGAKAKAKAKTAREAVPGEVRVGDTGRIEAGTIVNHKKRKSPSPGLVDDRIGASALGNGFVNVRKTLKDLPLFSTLPSEILHFLGLSAQSKTFPPFTDIIRQGSPGNEIFFIIRGEVEIIHLPEVPASASASRTSQHAQQGRRESFIRPRLKAGQYFGEVASLHLAPCRTATVRSITTVECLMISGETLSELWRRCSPDIRAQVEETARKRMVKAEGGEGGDVAMTDVDTSAPSMHSLEISDPRPTTVPTVTFAAGTKAAAGPPEPPEILSHKPADDSSSSSSVIEPLDPDPFLSVDTESLRARAGRRASWAPQPDGIPLMAPPTPPRDEDVAMGAMTPPPKRSPSRSLSRSGSSTSIDSMDMKPLAHITTPPDSSVRPKRARTTSLAREPSPSGEDEDQSRFGKLPEGILVSVFQHLDVAQLMKLRPVSSSWSHTLSTSPAILSILDLSRYNRRITNSVLKESIVPFVGHRPREIDMSNCFHVSDEGFRALWEGCGGRVERWRLRSVWDVSAGGVVEMVNASGASGRGADGGGGPPGGGRGEVGKGGNGGNCSPIREIDLANCRKVSDNLLARIVGWVVSETPPHAKPHHGGAKAAGSAGSHAASKVAAAAPPPGTVVGCPNLTHLSLGYCKHITDRSLSHLAAHTASRLHSLDLTRCTSLTDAGFQSWSLYRFPNLRKLVLADCTYLSDSAIVAAVGAAGGGLRELDLGFCCALSDTATEVVALGCPNLRSLKLSFCGSAVSDSSLRGVGLHLLELRELSVRGCVRVTGVGVEAVVEGCGRLKLFDVGQCRNLSRWLEGGGVKRWEARRRMGSTYGGSKVNGRFLGDGSAAGPATPGSNLRFITEKTVIDGVLPLR